MSSVSASHATGPAGLPALVRTGSGITQLHFDGKPQLLLAGELGNSTASHIPTLAGHWAGLREMGLNCVLLPVYWDLTEPVEGSPDFSLVRDAIDAAREHGLRLVLLWFGTWKNCMSCYAPGWVKRDLARFPRARRRDGSAIEIVSPFSDQARAADARVFAALLGWLKSYDAERQTVLMVQVENEIGMIPEPRDYSPPADAAWRGPVPSPILDRLTRGELGPEVQSLWQRAGARTSGSWAQVFGDVPESEDVFSAWHFAQYVETVTAAGKAEYALPMFVNAALIRPGYATGQYASGGPLPHLMEVWRTAAPSLDMLCPDIYFPNFAEWVAKYDRGGNPVFVPEMAASARVGGNALLAIARHGSIGVAPFSIENLTPEKRRDLAGVYSLLKGMQDLILAKQAQGKVTGLAPVITFDWQTTASRYTAQLGGITFHATFDAAAPAPQPAPGTTVLPTLGSHRWDAPPEAPRGAAMIIELDTDTFLIAGMGVVVTFAPADGTATIGIESVQEGVFADGEWRPGRSLNGDETHQGRHVHLYDGAWRIQRVKLYRYQ